VKFRSCAFRITCAFRAYTFATTGYICTKFSTTTITSANQKRQLLSATSGLTACNSLPITAILTTCQQSQPASSSLPVAACQQLLLARASSQQLAAITTY